MRLNIRRLKITLGNDTPILVSDDRSNESDAIKRVAFEEQVDYVCPQKRLSHHSGDWQAFINSIVYARQNKSHIAIKISQRLIPVMPEFWVPMFEAFANKNTSIVVPGRLNRKQVARPSAVFFTKFPLLTDILAMRARDVSPSMLLDTYKQRFTNATKHHDVLVEFAWNHLITTLFLNRTAVLDSWSNHEPFKAKLYLRKSQAIPAEYAKLGSMDGVSGQWNLHEWGAIERRQYLCRPKVV